MSIRGLQRHKIAEKIRTAWIDDDGRTGTTLPLVWTMSWIIVAFLGHGNRQLTRNKDCIFPEQQRRIIQGAWKRSHCFADDTTMHISVIFPTAVSLSFCLFVWRSRPICPSSSLCDNLSTTVLLSKITGASPRKEKGTVVFMVSGKAVKTGRLG